MLECLQCQIEVIYTAAKRINFQTRIHYNYSKGKVLRKKESWKDSERVNLDQHICSSCYSSRKTYNENVEEPNSQSDAQLTLGGLVRHRFDVIL